MDSTQKDLKIVISSTADTSGIDKTKQDLGGLSDQAKEGAGIVAGAFVAISAAVVGVGAYSTKAAADFEQSMELLQTQTGATSQEVKNMTSAVLNMSAGVGTNANVLAQGLYHIESAGVRGTQALDLLKIAAEGAKVGNADLESVSNALVASIVSGVGGIKDASQAMGVLNAIVGAGNMRMQDLTDAMSTGILPSARAFGLSIQDVGAALATMTDSGVPAQDAATRLRMTFSMLGAPTKAAAKELKSIGLTSTQLADDMRNKGLSSALEDLKTHLEKAGLTASQQAEVISRAFGGGRQSSALLTLLQNLDRMDTKFTAISTGTNSFGAQWQKASQEADFAFARLSTTVNTLAIRFGQILLPVVTKIASFLADNLVPAIDTVTKFFQQHKEAVAALALILTTGLVLGFIALAVVIAPVIAAVGAFLAAFGPVAIVIGAVAAFIILHWNQIKAATTEFVNTHKQLITDLMSVITGVIQEAFGVIEVLFGVFMAIFTGNWKKGWEEIQKGFKDIWNGIKNIVSGITDWIVGNVKGMVNSVIDVLNGLISGANNLASKIPGVSIKIPSIPHLAAGTPYFQGGVALVGENGPELVNLPQGSSVTPNKNIGQTVNINFNNPVVRSDNDIDTIISQVKYVLGRETELARLGAI